MRRVVVLAEAAEDLEEARSFYDAREAGVGSYCVTSLLANIESLALFHGIHCRQYGSEQEVTEETEGGKTKIEGPAGRKEKQESRLQPL